MAHFGPYAVVIAFWLFLTVVSVAGIIGGYLMRRVALEPLRTAIERGQQLDPAVVQQLMHPDHHDQPIDPSALQIGGIITIAASTGITALSFFIRLLWPELVMPVVGVGVLAICVGIGLLVAAWVLRRHRGQATGRGPNG